MINKITGKFQRMPRYQGSKKITHSLANTAAIWYGTLRLQYYDSIF
jgi:hypothetical protein